MTVIDDINKTATGNYDWWCFPGDVSNLLILVTVLADIIMNNQKFFNITNGLLTSTTPIASFIGIVKKP